MKKVLLIVSLLICMLAQSANAYYVRFYETGGPGGRLSLAVRAAVF